MNNARSIETTVLGNRRATSDSRGGFTLTEVIFASTLALFLFLVMLEALIFCRRSAANLKWRMAADAFAYDKVWEVFNHQTDWLESNDIYHKTPSWQKIPKEKTSVWLREDDVYYRLIINPDDTPPTYWVISVNVAWPTPNGGSTSLPQPCTVRRYCVNRNTFRNTP